jgi:hypothetical protein
VALGKVRVEGVAAQTEGAQFFVFLGSICLGAESVTFELYLLFLSDFL